MASPKTMGQLVSPGFLLCHMAVLLYALDISQMRSCAVAYSLTLEHLFSVLAIEDGKRIAALRGTYRKVKHGRLPIGLKIHLLPMVADHFDTLACHMGYCDSSGFRKDNMYRTEEASLCIVLPPVGSPDAAVDLIRALESYTGLQVFGNKLVQLQVCSPGRLDRVRTALLGASFYLGSGLLRKYVIDDFVTTVSGERYRRGRRLVLFDAYAKNLGEFDDQFSYWGRGDDSSDLCVANRLPIARGRSDVLVGITLPDDVANINLIATLLVHSQYGGYWCGLGQQFETEVLNLFESHDLLPVLEAPWACAGQHELTEETEQLFLEAITELVSYAHEEAGRIKRTGDQEQSILYGMQEILQRYKEELTSRAMSVQKEKTE